MSCSSGTEHGEDLLTSHFPEMLSLAEPSQVGSKHVGVRVGVGGFPTPTLGTSPRINPWMGLLSPSWLPEHHLQLPPCAQQLPARKSLFLALPGWECSFPVPGERDVAGITQPAVGIAAERGWEQEESAEEGAAPGAALAPRILLLFDAEPLPLPRALRSSGWGQGLATPPAAKSR